MEDVSLVRMRSNTYLGKIPYLPTPMGGRNVPVSCDVGAEPSFWVSLCLFDRLASPLSISSSVSTKIYHQIKIQITEKWLKRFELLRNG